MGNIERSRSLISLLYCLSQILYWSIGFFTVAYATAYLGRLGFANGTIGLITAVAGLCAFISVLLLSVRIDRGGSDSLYRIISGILLLQIILIVCLSSFHSAVPVAAVVYTLFLSQCHVLSSLLSKLYIDLKKRGANIVFSFARGLGSMAYAGSSFAVGYLLSRHPGFFIHNITLSFYVLLLPILFLLRGLSRRMCAAPLSVSAPEKQHSPLSPGSFVRSYAPFMVLTFGVSLVSASNRAFTTYLVNLVEELGGDIRAFTTITGFLALIEIPVMLLFSKLGKKFSISAMLLASLLLYTVKLGSAALARSLPLLFFAVAAQAFAAGLYHPASVEYIRSTAAHRDTAKCQALFDGTPVLMSFLTVYGFGSLLDFVSAKTMCMLLFLTALLGALIAAAAIFRVKKRI